MQVSAQVIGNDSAITIGGLQGQFELNVRIPLIARNLLSSLHLLSATATVFAEKCVDGIQANRAGTKASAGATLAVATALNGAIGYDPRDGDRQEKATASGRPLREVALEEGVDAALYDKTIDLRGSPGATRSERPRVPSPPLRTGGRGVTCLSPLTCRRACLRACARARVGRSGHQPLGPEPVVDPPPLSISSSSSFRAGL